MNAHMKVAIIHDWLVTYAGAERVLEQMIDSFPDADLFSTVDFLSEKDRSFLRGCRVTTSFIQKLPFARKHYRQYLPLMPLAIEQFDLSEYDLVISSSHAVAKGVLVGPDQIHICMCYSPIRYVWDLQHQYLKESGLDHGVKGWLARYMLHKIRLWDMRTAAGVDTFIAISHFIERRIRRVYRRDSVVVYPPVDVDAFAFQPKKEDFYFTASRMVPYKKIDLIVEAFSAMPNKRLIVIGDGPDFQKIQKVAGPNITLMGYQPFNVLKDHLQRAKAFVFAAEEDFGIAPIEAQACGTPVIAYGKGGALETIDDGTKQSPQSGLFFKRQTIVDICEAVNRFENETVIEPESCRKNAERFSIANFRQRFSQVVASAIDQAQ